MNTIASRLFFIEEVVKRTNPNFIVLAFLTHRETRRAAFRIVSDILEICLVARVRRLRDVLVQNEKFRTKT